MIYDLIKLSPTEAFKEGNVLRTMSRFITDFDSTLHGEIQKLKEIFESLAGVGLAAPQVGLFKRIIFVNPLKKSGDMNHFIAINPQILAYSEAKDDYAEGCLSIPE